MQSFRRYRYLTLAASLVACGDSTEPTSAPDISGAWTFTESAAIADQFLSQLDTVMCSARGSYDLNQTEWEFTGIKAGTIVCTRPEHQPAIEFDSVDFNLCLVNGELTETGDISFVLDGPGLMTTTVSLNSPVTGGTYSGALTGNPPNRLGGSFTEKLRSAQLAGTATEPGTRWAVSGSWDATRGGTAPARVAEVQVSPSTDTLIAPGETVQLSAVAKDACGETVTGQTFIWTSSNAGVATVNSTGLVTAAASGISTITATTGAVSGDADLTVRSEVTLTAMSAASNHTCGVTSAGAAYCWGSNYAGKLGIGHTIDRTTIPALVTGGLTFAVVSAGSEYTCGVTTSGAAYCWGARYASSPVLVEGAAGFASLSAGSEHTCALTGAGTAYCWGRNPHGQLGDGTTTFRNSPVLVSGGLTFVSLSAGGSHTCGVTAAGDAYCWGSNVDHQLGDGTRTDRTSPVLVSGGLMFASVRSGGLHTCGVTTSGTVYCWGSNSYGQLGDGATTGRTTPVEISGGHTFAAVSAGSAHTCGVTTEGAAYCWGHSFAGELGDGTTTDRTSPVLVSGGLTFTSVSAGGSHTCGVTTNGIPYCWGWNAVGQLGNGGDNNSSVPTPVGWW